MRAAVFGGTGDLGGHVVAELAARGEEVVVVSRNPPASGTPAALALGERVVHRRADVHSGAGLVEALDGVEVVVNAVGDARGRREVLVDGTRRLLEAERAAGVGHHVAISIVGCDRSPIGYHRVTYEQERLVADGSVPFSTLRATQFHGLLKRVFAAAGRIRGVPTGSGLLQPIDSAVVARRLADAAQAAPAGRLPDVAGPRVQTVGELADAWRAHTGRRLLSLPIPGVGGVGRVLREGTICNREAAADGPTFAEWLAGDRAGVRASAAR